MDLGVAGVELGGGGTWRQGEDGLRQGGGERLRRQAAGSSGGGTGMAQSQPKVVAVLVNSMTVMSPSWRVWRPALASSG